MFSPFRRIWYEASLHFYVCQISIDLKKKIKLAIPDGEFQETECYGIQTEPKLKQAHISTVSQATCQATKSL